MTRDSRPSLLVTKINFLGDTVSFLPTVSALRHHLPGWRIYVLCGNAGREIFANTVPDVEIITADRNQVGRPLKLVQELVSKLAWLGFRGNRIRMSLHSYDEPTFAYLLAFILGIPSRVGFDANISRGQVLLTTRLPFRSNANVVDINFDLVRHVTGRWDLKPTRLPIRYGDDHRRDVEDALRAVGIDCSRAFVAIHPGAKLSYKQWGLTNFSAVATYLERELGVPCVFVTESQTPELSMCRQIWGLDIPRLAALLDRAELFIGNNSGPMHVASAMGTPCVIVQGPSPANWEIFWPDVPFRVLKATYLDCVPCERLGRVPGRCLNTEYPNGCMREISPRQVVEAAAALLSAQRRQ